MTEKIYYQIPAMDLSVPGKIKDYSEAVIILLVIVLHVLFLWLSHLSSPTPLPILKQKVTVQTVHLNPANAGQKTAAKNTPTAPLVAVAAPPAAAAPKETAVLKTDPPPPKAEQPKEEPKPKASPAPPPTPAPKPNPPPAPTKAGSKPPTPKAPQPVKAAAAPLPASKDKEQKKIVESKKKTADLKIAQAPKIVEKNRVKKELEEQDYEKERIKKELEQQDYDRKKEKEALEKRDAERRREQEAVERRAEEKKRQAKIEADAAARRRREEKDRAARDAARRLALATVEKSLAANQESRNKVSASPSTHLPDSTMPAVIDKLHIDALPVDTEGMAQWTVKEIDYRDEVSQILQGALCLPEYGSVKIELTIHKSGKVEKVKVLASESNKNKQYIESKVPALYFPPFGARFPEKESTTFAVLLNNEYKN